MCIVLTHSGNAAQTRGQAIQPANLQKKTTPEFQRVVFFLRLHQRQAARTLKRRTEQPQADEATLRLAGAYIASISAAKRAIRLLRLILSVGVMKVFSIVQGTSVKNTARGMA